MFTRPLDSLNLTIADRESLRRAFFWEPEQHIDRIIYAAVPHRGSRFVDNPIGRLGVSLIKPPSQFSDFYARIGQDNPGAFTEEYLRLSTGKLDSVGSLSPDEPTLQILADLPNSHPVAVHSLIGDRGTTNRPLERTDDGIVPCISSHIEGAVSELVFPTKHKVFEHPEAQEEIVRILTDKESRPDGARVKVRYKEE